jgi:hypothetical protein
MAVRLAVLTSVAIHAAALAWLFLGEPARRTTVEVGVVGRPPAGTRTDVVLPPLGPADHLARRPSSPWPRAAVVDAPDRRAASRGGRRRGRQRVLDGREDARSSGRSRGTTRGATGCPRHRTAGERITTEARARTPRAGLDASYRPRLPRRRGPGPSGTVDPRPARPLVAQGPTATDAHRAAPFDPEVRPRDDAEAAQASDERRPQPFDLGRPRSGGPHDGAGVTGPVVDDGHARHDGDGAGGTPLEVARGTRAAVDAGPHAGRLLPQTARAGARARPLAARAGRRARAGRGGRVVHLRRDGSVSEVRVAKPSGFVDLDDAVVTRHPSGLALRPRAGHPRRGSRGLACQHPRSFLKILSSDDLLTVAEAIVSVAGHGRSTIFLSSGLVWI